MEETEHKLLLTDISDMNEEQLETVLNDAESAADCDMILAYREAAMRLKSSAPNVEKAWERFRSAHIEHKNTESRRMNIVAMVAAAAAVLLLFVVGWQYFKNENAANGPIMAFTANDEQQIVTLSSDDDDPQSIQQAAAESGIIVKADMADFTHVKAKDISRQTLTTPRGKAYKVMLSDGTTVILNADSRLTFPNKFSGSERVVQLVGEAYFNVAKDSKHPFIVETEKVKTRVLGTEFNMTAYPEQRTNVTLISGKVVVDDMRNKQTIELKPGENAMLQDNNKFKITNVDTEYYIQWKEGYFYFDNVTLIDVARELGRWYNVNIQINDNSLMSYRLHFFADRNEDINQVVQGLNQFSYLHVVKDGNKIIFNKKSKKQTIN